jgi:hypothetical protein
MAQNDKLHIGDSQDKDWALHGSRYLFLDGVNDYVKFSNTLAGQNWGFWLNHSKDWSMCFTIRNLVNPFYDNIFWATENAAFQENNPLRVGQPFLWISSYYTQTSEAGTQFANNFNSWIIAFLYALRANKFLQFFYSFNAATKGVDLYVNGVYVNTLQALFISNNHNRNLFNFQCVTIANANAGGFFNSRFIQMDLLQFMVTNNYITNREDVHELYHAKLDRSKYPTSVSANRLCDLAIDTQVPSGSMIIPDLMSNTTATIFGQGTSDYRLIT